MIFEQIATGGCQSYLIGCPDTRAGVLIDPEQRQIDRYLGLAAREGLRIRYVIDTHTHADHFSAAREIAATGKFNSLAGTIANPELNAFFREDVKKR